MNLIISYCVFVQLYKLCADGSAPPGDGDGGVSTKKKQVSWASDDNLATVHYFELDESERGVYNNTLHTRFVVCEEQL